jgi:hypothetical protein
MRTIRLFAMLFCIASHASAGSFADGQRAYDAGRFEDALGIWGPLAASGEVQAQFGLGLLHELGQGVPLDTAAAYGWYRRAAELGLTAAAFNVAVMHDAGRGVPRDMTEAALWYARAAARGHPRAQFNLAQLYSAGEGVPRNPALAEAWYRAAAASLPAAAARLPKSASRAPAAVDAAPAAAQPVAPADGASVAAKHETTTIELVWEAPASTTAVQYFVEVMALEQAGPRELFAGYHDTSAMLLNVKRVPGDYAWRVSVVGAEVPRYAVSNWSRFAVVAD